MNDLKPHNAPELFNPCNEGQKTVDFTTAVHRRENNPISQDFLDRNRNHFTGQAAIVLTELQKGNPVYAEQMKDVYNISSNSFIRRIADLGDCKSMAVSRKFNGDMAIFISEYGVDIDREWMIDMNGKTVKQMMYFLPENRQKFIDRKLIINRARWWYSLNYTPKAIIDSIKCRTDNKIATR